MSAPEKMGKASVRFYLNDGYTAPEEVEEEAVDTKSERYCTMIERSLMNLGNTYRIRKAKEVTLAYIGGSITQGAEQHRSIPSVMPISPISFSKADLR